MQAIGWVKGAAKARRCSTGTGECSIGSTYAWRCSTDIGELPHIHTATAARSKDKHNFRKIYRNRRPALF